MFTSPVTLVCQANFILDRINELLCQCQWKKSYTSSCPPAVFEPYSGVQWVWANAKHKCSLWERSKGFNKQVLYFTQQSPAAGYACWWPKWYGSNCDSHHSSLTLAASCQECEASKLLGYLVEVEAQAMNMPLAAPYLERVALQPQNNLPAVPNLENMASQPQDNLPGVTDATFDVPRKGKKHQHSSGIVVRSKSLIFMGLSHWVIKFLLKKWLQDWQQKWKP